MLKFKWIRIYKFGTLVGLMIFSIIILQCNYKSNPTKMKTTPVVVYFEIPVSNMNRAISFYQKVFGFGFGKEFIDGNEMALFPFSDNNSGVSGALAKGEIYKPTKDGVLIYFNVKSIKETLDKAKSNGGKQLYPKTDNGIGYVAEFEDSEGNRIALFEPIK